MARIYVIYGQGGILTSFGMYLLAQRIMKAWPKAVVTTHSWGNPNVIATDVRSQNIGTPVILIGYSLGANDVPLIALQCSRAINLGVCYDPSKLGEVQQPGANIKRLLLYHNNDWEPEGHAVFVGPMVETTEIDMAHLAICYSEALHQKTLAAVARVLA